MTRTAPDKRRFTYEDYLKTPEGGGYELLAGDLVKEVSPVTRHQRISRNLLFALHAFVSKNERGEVFEAPLDVYFDRENVVQPDILFVKKERAGIIAEKNVQGAPDLLIEILSEDSAYRDMVQKKQLYARFGVKEYWIVIPENETVEIHLLNADRFSLHRAFGKNEPLESPCLTGLKLDLSKVF